MQIIISPEEKRFGVALTTALLLHLGVLLLHVSMPQTVAQPKPGGPLTVTVAKPKALPPPSRLNSRKRDLPKPKTPRPPSPVKPPRPLVPLLAKGESSVKLPLAVPPPVEEKRSWTRAEKEEIDDFLNPAPARPQTAQQLAQSALAAARSLPPAETVSPQEKRELAQQNARLSQVEPFTLEMYFDALYRKLNQTARFVKRSHKEAGRNAAAVRIVLNADGTVKSFRVLWAADQQAEIAYVNKLFESAAPFSPFPPAMLRATDSMVLEICIKPGSGDSGGLFSPMEPGSRCH